MSKTRSKKRLTKAQVQQRMGFKRKQLRSESRKMFTETDNKVAFDVSSNLQIKPFKNPAYKTKTEAADNAPALSDQGLQPDAKQADSPKTENTINETHE